MLSKLNRLAYITGSLLLSAPPAFADVKNQLCTGAGGSVSSGSGCSSNLTGPLNAGVKNITDTLLFVAGAVAVIVIIIAGIRYITSTGDATRIEQSKNTLLYAVTGLVVVIVAYAVVHFVATSIH